MTNVTVPNFALAASNDTRSAVWKLSRAMKAAGWVTLSSSDGTTKDTTGAYDNDKWSGSIGAGSSGGGANITTVVGGVATLTGLTGFATGTAGQRWIKITAASNGGNIGAFKILSFISASSVTIRNPVAVAETGTISWAERIPLSDTYTIGTRSWINMQGPSVLKIPISTIAQDGYQVNILGNNQTGTTARIAAFNAGLITVSGLTNMTIGSSSNVLVISGASDGYNNGSFTIVKQLDSNTVLIANPSGVVLDANNGSIHWQERIGVTGTRGENVTQTTTGAQGEVVGINFDYLTGTGYLVVFPRNNGSGAGPFGWNGTDVITGSISSAVWTPTVTPVEFIREIVMWAPTTTGPTNILTFTGYMQCINASTENSSRFSVLAATAGATATVAPGGAASGVNAFPTPGSYAWIGTGGAQTFASFGMITLTGTMTNAQIMCADATFDLNRSADGSFTCAIGVPTTITGGGYIGFCFTRLDDQEDGEVDPYIFYNPSVDTLYSTAGTNRISLAGVASEYNGGATTGKSFNAGTGTETGTTDTNSTSSCNFSTFRGWRGRGTSNDSFQTYQIGLLTNGANTYTSGSGGGTACLLQISNTTIAAGSNTAVLPQATINVASASTFTIAGTLFVTTSTGVQTVTYTGTTATTFTGCAGGGGTMSTGGVVTAADPDVVSTTTVSTAVDTNSVYVGEPIWVVSAQPLFRSMKGSCRWLRAVQLGTITDTLGAGSATGFWLQLCTGSTTVIPFVSGPWDGSTTPVK